MKKILIILTLFFIGIYGISPVHAQQDEIKSLTLAEALQKVLQQNLDIKQSANLVQMSDIAYSQSRNNLLPDLNAAVSAAQGYNRNYNANTGKTSAADVQNVSAGLQSSVNLFNGLGDIASIRQAEYELESEELSYERRKEDILYQTALLFIQAVTDKELIDIEEENLAAQQNQLELILEFYNAGSRSLADVLQQRADMAQAELQLLNAHHTYQISMLNLLEILGQEPETNYSLTAPDEDLYLQEHLSNNLTPGILTEQRLDWKAQKSVLSAAQEQIRVSKAGYWPALGLSISAGSSYSNSLPDLNFHDQFSDVNPYISAGLTLTIPIFDRFRIKNNVQSAVIQLENERLTQEKLNLSIQLDIQQARLGYETALKQIQTAQAKLDYAEQAFEVTEARYNAGSATYVELSQLRAAQVTAANEEVQANFNVLLKKIALGYQQGNLNELLNKMKLLERQS